MIIITLSRSTYLSATKGGKKKLRRLWHLGNTTVRSPFRLRDGLIALSSSPLQGKLHGKKQEIAFRDLLGERNIVGLGKDETYSVGRKWRVALNQMGFLVPEIPAKTGVSQSDIGLVDTITENGWRLIQAEPVPSMQECFLRALAAYFIPNPSEKDYSFAQFSPLRHTLSVLFELERQTGDSRLEFIEMAVIVQTTSPDDGIKSIVKRILDFRTKRKAAKNKRGFDSDAKRKASEAFGYVEGTFGDYADTNFRYLKATGFVQTKGHGISIFQDKRALIEQLVKDTSLPASPTAYYKSLCDGAKLPTDRKEGALVVLEDLIHRLKVRGIKYDLQGKLLNNAANIAIERHKIEEMLSELEEEDYATKQAELWQEIGDYMELLITRCRSKVRPNGEEIGIPQSESPAYLEWTLWRAFLAINHLKNKPYDARNFKIDQDFLPVCTAPGKGPDLLFEFDSFVLVVEVTLLESSRQEAAEGESVRRHVANITEQYPNKPVYGLFIANKIDPNTMDVFQLGRWYKTYELKVQIDIVAITLEQFYDFFLALFNSKEINPSYVRKLIDSCIENRKCHEISVWKQKIEKTVRSNIALLSN